MATSVVEAPTLVPMLGTSEVAKLFNVKVSTVLRWTSRGVLPSPVVVGRTKRWPRKTIEALATGRKDG